VDERLRERVRGELIDRGGESEPLVGLEAAEDDEAFDLRRAQCEGAGLVEDNGLRLAELLDGGPALDDDPGAGRP
jgi:hypothetical protein